MRTAAIQVLPGLEVLLSLAQLFMPECVQKLTNAFTLERAFAVIVLQPRYARAFILNVFCLMCVLHNSTIVI